MPQPETSVERWGLEVLLVLLKDHVNNRESNPCCPSCGKFVSRHYPTCPLSRLIRQGEEMFKENV